MGKQPSREKIDPMIQDVVHLFNRFACLETIGSCSGHAQWRGNPKGARPYISYWVNTAEAYPFTRELAVQVQEIYGPALTPSIEYDKDTILFTVNPNDTVFTKRKCCIPVLKRFLAKREKKRRKLAYAYLNRFWRDTANVLETMLETGNWETE